MGVFVNLWKSVVTWSVGRASAYEEDKRQDNGQDAYHVYRYVDLGSGQWDWYSASGAVELYTGL